MFCDAKDMSFAEVICKRLKAPLGLCHTKHFPNGELSFQLNEDIKENNVIILKRFSKSIHQDIWELMQMVDTVHRMQARSITLILPYLPYVRQHRCSATGQFSTCQLLVNSLKTAGADKIITIDMHAPEQCANFCTPVINIPIEPFWINYLQTLNLNWDNISIFGADKSAALRAEKIARHFNGDWGYIDKKRNHKGTVSVQGFQGDCYNKRIFLVDDIIDTGATITQATQYLKDSGALDITVLATHCLLNKKLIKTFENRIFNKLVLTDTRPTSLCPMVNLSIEHVFTKDVLMGVIENID